MLHTGVEAARFHPGPVQLDQSDTSGREEGVDAGEKQDRVAADSDVAVEEKRRRPVAGAGDVGEDRHPGRGRPPAVGRAHRGGGHVDAEGGVAGLDEGGHVAARPAAHVEDGALGPGQDPQLLGRDRSVPAAHRQRYDLADPARVAETQPGRRARPVGADVGRMPEQFVGPRADLGHRARQHARASAAATDRAKRDPGTRAATAVASSIVSTSRSSGQVQHPVAALSGGGSAGRRPCRQYSSARR